LLSALEALRNALYKCSTYLLTYLLTLCVHSVTKQQAMKFRAEQ